MAPHHAKDQMQILSPTEQNLRRIWAAVLERRAQSILRTDDFMSLGGDSLTAMRAAANAREAGLHVGVVDFVDRTTLAEMAASADQYAQNAAKAAHEDAKPFALWKNLLNCDAGERSRRIGPLAAICGAELTDIEDVYPCTSMQEGLLAMTAQRSGTYSVQNVFRLKDSVDVNQFCKALDSLVEALPILRTRIVATNSCSLQLVLKKGPLTKSVIDLQPYLVADAQAPFAYGTPLHRFAIVRSGVNDGRGGQFLIWSAHHAAYDGWSMLRMLTLLKGIMKNEPEFVPAPVSRHVKYLLEAESREIESTTYWQSQLEDVSWETFPATRCRQPRAHCSRKQRFTETRRRRIYPIPILLRGAWAIVVATRNTYADESTFNVLFSGREIPVFDIEDVVAPTIITAPVRVRIDWSQTVVAFLATVQEQVTGMTPHIHMGLHKIRSAVPDLSAEFDPGHLFTVLPAYSQDLDAIMQELGLEMDFADGRGFDDMALAVECTVDPNTDSIEVEIHYDDRVLSEEEVEALLAQYQHIVRQFDGYNDADRDWNTFAQDPPLDDLDLISLSDISTIQKWNQNLPNASDECLHDLFQKAVVQYPEALAVDAWDGRFTFTELYTSALKVARRLVELGVKNEVGVGLCFSKSKMALVAMLGILYAGGAVVPLGASIPLARIQEIVMDCRIQVVVVDAAQAARLRSAVAHVLILDDQFFSDACVLDFTSLTLTIPQNACWIAYTSGTTGVPKGIVLEHAAYSTSVIAQSVRDGFSSSTRALQFADYTYDAVVEETFAVWLGGGCSCVPSEEQRLNDLPGFLHSMRINFIAATPSVASLIQPTDVPTLRTITFGGEAVRPVDVQAWLKDRSIQVMNSYGPTECSIIASQSENMRNAEDAPNIGYPLASRFWIVDPRNRQRLCPLGSPGELLIEGPVLAREYLNDSQKSAAAFLIDPQFVLDLNIAKTSRAHGTDPVRMYCTGDMVRQHFDGSFTHLGRCDAQLKVRGQRMEREDIESRILQLMPEARHACVDLVELDQAPGNPLLLTMIEMPALSSDKTAARKHVSAVVRNLRSSLSEVLPGFAVPRHILITSSLPVTSSGKLDRRATHQRLKALTLDDLKSLDEQLSPGNVREPTTTEICIRQLWSQVLGHAEDVIGINDDFRQLGGDSISAMRLAALARATNIQIKFADVARYPRLCDLARAVDTQAATGSRVTSQDPRQFQLCQGMHGASEHSRQEILGSLAELCDVSPNAIEDAYPSTPMQVDMMESATSSTPTCASQLVFRAKHPFDIARLRSAMANAWKTLPFLRTRLVHFRFADLQVVIREDIDWLSGSNLSSYLDKDRETPFAYGTSLHRFAILPDSAEDARSTSSASDRHTYFVWTAHPSASDGWTLLRVFEMLAGLYSGRQMSSPGYTPIPRFAAYLTQLQGQREKLAKYWDKQLRGAPLISFPKSPPHDHRSNLSCTLKTHISRRHTPNINTSISSFLRAAWAIVVGAFSASDEALLAVAESGRDVPVADIDDMIAPTTTIVPVRIKLDPTQPIPDFLTMVEQQSVEMGPYVHTGVQQLQAFPGTGERYDPGNLFIVQPDSELYRNHLLETLDLESFNTNFRQFEGYAMVVTCVIEATTDVVDLEIRFDEDVIAQSVVSAILRVFRRILVQLSRCGAAKVDLHGIDMIAQTITLGQLNLTDSQDEEDVEAEAGEVH